MSYGSRLNVIECNASIQAGDVRRARRGLKNNDCYPESCFLDDMQTRADDAVENGLGTATLIPISKERCWFSGNHINAESLEIISERIVGKLSGYFVGEDGCIYDGFVIENGVLTKCEISVTLTPIKAPT